MARINPLIALAIPTWGKVSINWARAMRHIGGPLGANTVDLAPVIGRPIAEARNELMKEAVEQGCDFIFFLGDDVLAMPDTVTALLQRLWDHEDIAMVTGMYWTKSWPTQPYIWRGIQRGPYMDWKHGEFFEVDYAGCDCLLIRLSPEMKALGPEWFSTDWVWEEKDQLTILSTEDFYFFTKARKAGLKLWCDTNVQCIHEDRQSMQQFGLTDAMPQYGMYEEPELPDAKTDVKPLVKLADLGAGFNSPYFGRADRVKVVRFDNNEDTHPDYRCDIRRMPVEDQNFDVVHSRHVLEHFGRGEIVKVLKESVRILRIGGEFRMSVPNIIGAIKQIVLMEEEMIPVDPYPFWQLYGRQADSTDFHLNGFTPRRIKLLMERIGVFEDIEVTTADGPDEDYNIYVKALKVRHLSKSALLPEWDEIERQEGMVMAGRDNGHEETLELPPELKPKKRKRVRTK